MAIDSDAAAAVFSAPEFKMVRETKVTPIFGLWDNVVASTALGDHWFDFTLHVPVPHQRLVEITWVVVSGQAWWALGLFRVLCRNRGAWCWTQHEHVDEDSRKG